jgi:hypothetical protein
MSLRTANRSSPLTQTHRLVTVPKTPPDAEAKDILLNFSLVDLHGSVSVFDIWEQKTVGSFEGAFTAKAVPYHGSAFLRLSPA